MKNLIFTAGLIASASANACLGEAQIIAPVTTYQETMMSCKAFINLSKVIHFKVNSTCPLDLADIASQGVEVGLKNGHDCAIEVGENLNGVVVRNAAGVLILE